MPGFGVGKKEDKLGARGLPSCPLYFENVFIPEKNRLGEEGHGFKAVMEGFSGFRPVIGARAVWWGYTRPTSPPPTLVFGLPP